MFRIFDFSSNRVDPKTVKWQQFNSDVYKFFVRADNLKETKPNPTRLSGAMFSNPPIRRLPKMPIELASEELHLLEGP